MFKAFIVSVILIAGGVFVSGSEKKQRNFRDFSGLCQITMKYFDTLDTRSVGWARQDVFWNRLEGKGRGQWNDKYFKEHYLERFKLLLSKDVRLLPVLAYGVPWGSKKQGEEAVDHFELAGREYKFTMQPDGSCIFEQFHDKSVNGKIIRESSKRHFPYKKMATRWLCQENIKDWENYVRKIVRTLRKPPYNLEYFQIWNEAWPSSGFWRGNMDAYMRRIHFPAAKIIHEEGGKVVYGGWPCGAPIKFFVEFLDKYKAWDSIDILDIHYFPLAAMDYLAKELKKRGLDKGIWQTEIGFTTDQNFIGDNYPRALYWALKNNWDWGDKYKYFYFAHNNANDPKAYGYGRNLYVAGKPTPKAHSLITLSRLLEGGNLDLYEKISSKPALSFKIDERLSSLEAFKVGNKIICAVHLKANNKAKIFVDWEGEGDTIHLDHENVKMKLYLPEIAMDQVAKISRVSMTGYRQDISALAVKAESGIEVPVYIRDPKQPEHDYIEMPEGQLPAVFYVEIALK